MVHPCIPDYEGGGVELELHACHSTTSSRTLCKKKAITADDIDRTDGATLLCRDCYANDRSPQGDHKDVPIPPG
jgi:hypothetical protein